MYEVSASKASELRIVYEGTKTTINLVNCPEPGLGLYYLVFSYEPKDAQILNVSPRFVADYNIINNTILIAGIQGELPGPTGDIELVEIISDREIKLNLVTANIKDVNGSSIYTLERHHLVQRTQTPASVMTPTPGPTDVSSNTPATPLPTSLDTPSLTSSISTLPEIHETPNSQQEGQGTTPQQTSKDAKSEVPIMPTQTPIKTPSPVKIQEYGTKKIPLGGDVLLVLGLVVIYVLHHKRKSR